MNDERLCVWCEYARDREDIAGVYCTGGFCNLDGTCEHFREYVPPEIETNADRIRGMGDAELAKYLAKTFLHGYGQLQLLDWLQQPAMEGADV